MAKPHIMAIFGTSTGGALTLAMVLRAKAEKLPLPAAIAPRRAWADINRIGDSYNTNEWVDNVLVTWESWLGRGQALCRRARPERPLYLAHPWRRHEFFARHPDLRDARPVLSNAVQAEAPRRRRRAQRLRRQEPCAIPGHQHTAIAGGVHRHRAVLRSVSGEMAVLTHCLSTTCDCR
jgi:acetyl esterase/lipase